MNRQITRPILWNVPTSFIVVMYALLALLLLALFMSACIGTGALRWERLRNASINRYADCAWRFVMGLGKASSFANPGAGCTTAS